MKEPVYEMERACEHTIIYLGSSSICSEATYLPTYLSVKSREHQCYIPIFLPHQILHPSIPKKLVSLRIEAYTGIHSLDSYPPNQFHRENIIMIIISFSFVFVSFLRRGGI